MTLNILGTKYTVRRVAYGKDPTMTEGGLAGYCNGISKKIVLVDGSTVPDWADEPPETIAAMERETLRHEIIHAYLDESGLCDSANPTEAAWSKNEEMVDWFAIQWPKISKTFAAAGCAE